MQFPVMGMAGIALGVADVKVFARELSEKAVSQSRDLMEKRHAEMKDGRGRRRGPKDFDTSFWGSWMDPIFPGF